MKKIFKLDELDCANCGAKMENAIRKIKGVNSVNVNFMAQKMTVDADDELFDSIMEQAVKICRKIEPDCEIIM